MRIHCKVVAVAAGFGVFLLLYFLGGNGADEPLLPREVGGARGLEEDSESSWSPSSHLETEAKLARKAPAEVGRERRRGSVSARSKFQNNVVGHVPKLRRAEEVMHLAVVACGNRLDETLTMVKSALLFSLKKIKFHIFAEDPLVPRFEEKRSLTA
ncbi:glucoside xylosyltransferase 2-like [Nematolebias whitei]|uniref:glucoside xylosyltransferase 2-like n=1 Tax=Nematolebias whitei TaxID=451745 RepID=UPI00189AAA6F|nr:glucoside xylosyltransferase 2-like [Nematolebias whitei]